MILAEWRLSLIFFDIVFSSIGIANCYAGTLQSMVFAESVLCVDDVGRCAHTDRMHCHLHMYNVFDDVPADGILSAGTVLCHMPDDGVCGAEFGSGGRCIVQCEGK